MKTCPFCSAIYSEEPHNCPAKSTQGNETIVNPISAPDPNPFLAQKPRPSPGKTLQRIAGKCAIVVGVLIGIGFLIYLTSPRMTYKAGQMFYGHYSIADPLLEKACNGGVMEACNQLAANHEDGVDGGVDHAQALHYYQKSCAGGNMPGCVGIAEIYDWGRGVPVNKEYALVFYKKACDGGWMEGCLQAASVYEMGIGSAFPDDTQARVFAKRACDGGEMAGCYLFGSLLERGEGGAPDYAQAGTLYQKACNSDYVYQHNDSCGAAALLFQSGKGGSQDYAQARAYFQKSCDGEPEVHADSCIHLGWLNEKGEGGSQDYAQALTLYQRACETNREGCLHAGDIYKKGLGVAQDSAQAQTLYLKACNDIDQSNCRDLRQQVDQDEGGVQDQSQAAGNRTEAPRNHAQARQEKPPALQSGCGGENQQGCGGASATEDTGSDAPAHDARAILFYRKACDGGDARSCASLGELNERGIGVPLDSAKARTLYQKACDGGEQSGCGKLKKMR